MKNTSNPKHWADKFADEVINRKKKKEYIVESGITPSGIVHIGNFREIMTQYYVYKALSEKTKAVFQYVWDDYDRFRKVPKGVPEEYEKYIGMPVCDVPDPWDCHKSYAQHFIEPLEKECSAVGINPKYIYQSIEHRKCTYAEQIKTALGKTDLIQNVLNKFRKEPLEKDWMPAIVYCEKCGHESMITKFEDYTVTYKCNCGNTDSFDFRKKGLIKLRWRIDWPARWQHYDIDFESSGKDHKASGGSWDTGVQISKQVFGQEPPIGPMYEFIYLKGQKEKMSSSKGNVATISELLEIFEPEVIRYLYTAKVNKAVDIPFDMDILNLYNYYDAANEADENEKRKYMLSQISKKETILPQFSVCANTIQITQGDKEKAVKILQETNHIKKSNDAVLKRLELAWNWTQKYAPDDFKFTVQENMPAVKVPKDIQEIFAAAADEIEKEKSGDEVQNFIFNTSKEKNIKQPDVFKFAYKLFLNKERGPRLGPLLVSLDKDFVIKRLRLQE